MSRETVVIIGAGRCGRGYLARQIDLSRYRLVFVDQNPELISALRKIETYQIRFWENSERNIQVSGYEAFLFSEIGAWKVIQQARWIMLCVGRENLGDAIDKISEICSCNENPVKKTIIAAENGVGNRQILERHWKGGNAEFTECLLFCTTEAEEHMLDIWSEDLDDLPYSSNGLTEKLPFWHFRPCDTYDVLVRRKIYTYNSLSACIAYLGAWKRYENYGEAAMDSWIYQKTEEMEQELDVLISREYSVPEDEQKRFSAMAKQKFRNQKIRDTVVRNARNALRKLGPGERLAEPLRLALKSGIYVPVLELTAAAAFFYGIHTEQMDEQLLMDEACFLQLMGFQADEKAKHMHMRICKNYCDLRKR